MEWKKSVVVGIIAGIVLIGSIIGGILTLVRQPKYPRLLICEGSGTIFEQKIPLNAQFPLSCPDSGKKDAYLAAKITCKQDGEIFYRAAKPFKMADAKYPMPPQEAILRSGITCPKDGSKDLKIEFDFKAQEEK